MNDFILKSYVDKLSINHIKEYAKKNNIVLKNKFKLLLSIFNDSGIKSKSETHTITPDAKDNEEVIILSLFFDEKNITDVPNIVAKPAKEVIKKL